jgi:hypothetical protein
MKTIFTFLIIIACTFFPSKEGFSQNCNYTSGGNGISTALPAVINIDGNMADWAVYLNDPDNNSYDNTNGNDLDAPIADAGRNLSRFTFTEDANNFYLYLKREGSSNNKVDIIFYADINNNSMMDLNEPVIHIDWSGSNGNVNISSYNYIPSTTSILNSITDNLDGSALWGALQYRNNSSILLAGQGSSDGLSVEIKIPFTQLTQLNATGDVINQLAFGHDFTYHVSTINGNISSMPNANSINDNFGGCLKAPVSVLPVKLKSFSAMLINNKVDLKWTTATETNLSHFVIERSTDGRNFSDAGMVFAYGNTTANSDYTLADNISNIQSGIIYYRLRSVEVDGKSIYSDVRIIRIGKQEQNNITIATYPNPAASEVHISIPASWQNKKVVYEVFSVNGQAAKKMETSSSSQTETLNVSNLNSGLYIVKVTCEGQIAQQKIVKQ